jgi:hypothetical protein
LGLTLRIFACAGNIGATKHYQRYAVRCLQEARTETDSQHKSFLIEMAQTWRSLAEQASADINQADSSITKPDRGD